MESFEIATLGRVRPVPSRRRAFFSWVGGLATRQWLITLTRVSFVSLCLMVIAYLIVPQVMLDKRISQAEIIIDECALEIGKNSLDPTLRFRVSKDVLKLPFVSFTSYIGPTEADFFFYEKDFSEKILLGTFETDHGVLLDSSRDLNIKMRGKVTITRMPNLPRMVHTFLHEPFITMAAEAIVDVSVLIWGWIPFKLYGMKVRKALTIPAFDGFRKQDTRLDELIYAHGEPGRLNVTATALVYNPTPVTLIVNDAFQMQVFYESDQKLQRMGTLLAKPPIELRPKENLVKGTAMVWQTPENEKAFRELLAEYVGPQHGFSPVGAGERPVKVWMQDDGDSTSASSIIREATRGLLFPVNMRPKPIYFLKALTADIVMFGRIKPPFYTVIIHLLVKNPVPQVVRVKKVDLVAFYPDLQGKALYTYSHEIKEPRFKPQKYVMSAMQEGVIDFRLSPTREVSWEALLDPMTIEDLAKDALIRTVSMGVKMNITMLIDDGYEQVIYYENNMITGQLCFSPIKPKTICGDLMSKLPSSSSDEGSDSDDESESDSGDPADYLFQDYI